MNEIKKRVLNSLHNYSARLHKNATTPKRKNQKPEKLVEKDCLAFLRQLGCAVYVVESKAHYSAQAGAYVSQSAQSGFSDLVGCLPNGLFLAVELKAKGRRSTLKPNQREFLVQKIQRGGFGVCVDSVAMLESVYNQWTLAPAETKRTFLMSQLPPDKTLDDSPLFPD